jgi:nucleoside-diphosphate-sugar epimerase
MSTLITGAAGFIGSNLTKILYEKLHSNLILLDNFSRGKQEYLDYFDVRKKCLFGELKNFETADVFTKNVDTVFHTACRIGGMQFLHGGPEQEITALQENLIIDSNVLKACLKNKVRKIIFTSSVSVYNTKKQQKINASFKESDIETDPIDPEGGYGWSKFIAEKQLDYLSQCGIKVGILRIFKAYGPCDDYSPESGQVVCSLMRKAINYPKEDFVVWGDGSAERCLLYIDDLVDAMMRVSDALETRDRIIVNVGGNKVSMSELATKIVSLSKKNISITYDPSRPSGPASRIPDMTVAKRELNWKPTTSLDEGLNKTWSWMDNTFHR